jgi:hypothetical protein
MNLNHYSVKEPLYLTNRDTNFSTFGFQIVRQKVKSKLNRSVDNCAWENIVMPLNDRFILAHMALNIEPSEVTP